MIALDGTENKGKLGANATMAEDHLATQLTLLVHYQHIMMAL